MSELRLFPLKTVLFPGMALPLRVFEDRYRQLISECVASVEPFGVVLIREGDEIGESAIPHDIGTTATIESLEHDADGVIQLLATGVQRFRISELYDDRPYLWANVEYPLEDESAIAEPAEEQLRERYAALLRLQRARRGEYVREPSMPPGITRLTDAVGASLDAGAEALQALLSTFDVTERAERAVALLRDAIPIAERDARIALIERRGGTAAFN